MSNKLIVDDNFASWPAPAEPIEDKFVHATEKQINYIERLRIEMGMSAASRNRVIADIVNSKVRRFPNDLWALSRSEASQVINKFKEWKEAR